MRAAIALLLCSAGCTLATDAGDRQVDARIGRDLQYTFKSMDAHAGVPLDVVLASQPAQLADSPVKLRFRTHARLVLPAAKPEQPYPDITLHLANVMDEPGPKPELLLFYADTDDNNEIFYGILSGSEPRAEHIWREDVPATGIGEFKHSTNFLEFAESEYSLATGNIVLELDANAPDWRPAPCENGAEHTLEVRVTLAPNDVAPREIGYYRNYSSNPSPTKSIILEDVVDAGNLFSFEVLIDGVLAREPFTASAAQNGGNLVIPQLQWYPVPPTTGLCPTSRI